MFTWAVHVTSPSPLGLSLSLSSLSLSAVLERARSAFRFRRLSLSLSLSQVMRLLSSLLFSLSLSQVMPHHLQYAVFYPPAARKFLLSSLSSLFFIRENITRKEEKRVEKTI